MFGKRAIGEAGAIGEKPRAVPAPAAEVRARGESGRGATGSPASTRDIRSRRGRKNITSPRA